MSFTRTPCPSSRERELGLGQAVGHVYRARAAGGVLSNPTGGDRAQPGRASAQLHCPVLRHKLLELVAEVGGTATGTLMSACSPAPQDMASDSDKVDSPPFSADA